MAVLVFLGFGELATSLADGLANGARHEIRAYLRKMPAPDSLRSHRLAQASVQPRLTLSEALSGADAVLAAVPASAAAELAEQCAPLLTTGTLYVDLPSASPEQKVATCERITSAGGVYVDGAVLGTVLTSGPEVPILASGPGAEAFRELVEADGLNVTAIDAPAGRAALVKLLRGVYLKGRDALVFQMMLAARRHGVEDLVARSIDGPGERMPFTAIAERTLRSLAIHAERRAEELAAASDLIADVGIDPAMTSSGVTVLRAIGALGLAELYRGERPNDAHAVLEAIDERLFSRS